MNPKELAEKISHYEGEIGESWTDQGGVQFIKELDYIEFLKRKGYSDRIQEMIDNDEFLNNPGEGLGPDWNDFMEVIPQYSDDMRNTSWTKYMQNLELISEFIIESGPIALQQNIDWIDMNGASHKGSMRWDRRWDPEGYVETIKRYPQWELDEDNDFIDKSEEDDD